MAIRITDECVNCGACVSSCPNDAISEGEDIYVIDPERCSECVGFHNYAACNAVCGPECCEPDPDRVESEEVLLARARALHPGEDLHATPATSRFQLNLASRTT